MIIFEFEIDEEELAEDLEFDIPSTDYDLFVLTFFLMPIRLNIQGVEFFRHDRTGQEDYWYSMPIIDLASNFLRTVKSLPELEIDDYELFEGGIFKFKMLPDNNISISYDNKFAEVRYDEFLKACEGFTSSVRKFFNERVPQLHQHKFWGLWLRGEFD